MEIYFECLTSGTKNVHIFYDFSSKDMLSLFYRFEHLGRKNNNFLHILSSHACMRKSPKKDTYWEKKSNGKFEEGVAFCRTYKLWNYQHLVPVNRHTGAWTRNFFTLKVLEYWIRIFQPDCLLGSHEKLF